MSIAKNQIYQSELESIIKNNDFKKLRNSAVLITGATGQIGSSIIDLFCKLNQDYKYNIKIYALSRNQEKAVNRFGDRMKYINYICADIAEYQWFDFSADYIIHCASNSHPIAFFSNPINTINANILGLNNLLMFAKKVNAKRTIFLSSGEIYGQNRGDTQYFSEDYCGYIDCNTLRAGYNESKRLGESLCQAGIKQYGIDAVIIRLPRVFGPTMQSDDSKASAQFLLNAVKNEDIVLKSRGEQLFSYLYTQDAVSAVLFVLLNGKNGEAYNASSKDCNVKLCDFAKEIASAVGKKVVFDLPSEAEKQGFSLAQVALLDSSKIQALGWKSQFSLSQGINNSIKILSQLNK